MRDLTTAELDQVYGAGCSPCPPKSGKKSKGKKSGSKGKKSGTKGKKSGSKGKKSGSKGKRSYSRCW